jgi:dipeptidyl aminopeptidase/acylaminoacyl peptidase
MTGRFLAFAVAVASLAANASHALSVALESLFAEPALQRVTVNPSGTLVAAHAVAHSGSHSLLVQVVSSGKVSSYRTPFDIDYWWEDDDTLIVREGRVLSSSYVFIDVKITDSGPTLEAHKTWFGGELVDPLPLSSNDLLWSTGNENYGAVYRLSVSAILDPKTRLDDFRVARVSGRVVSWISDASAVPRAALVQTGDDPIAAELLYRPDARANWSTAGSWSGKTIEKIPILVGMAANGRDLLVVSGEGRETAALRNYLVDEQRLGEVVYANPLFDIVDVVFDVASSQAIAVVYEEGGIRRYHYLDETDAAQQAALDRLFPDKSAHLTSFTRDRRYLTALVNDARDPGHYYFVDRDRLRTKDLGAVMPWLEPSRLAPVKLLQVKAKDGRAIDAFLALPVSFTGSRPPLIVMPHGGPVGVADTREFDPVLQSLAVDGYAVLQVNYRGSGGKGADFLDAGRGAWGGGIEDDIEAALDHVVAAKQVDPERVCIFGASYGGYSALISITRRPQRYRCAVAVAAPTDLLLSFDSSDFAATEDGRREFAEIVGDPDRDRDHLIAVSPAYRAQEMDVPILLVHGDRDRRVDLEHAYRMRAMLDAYHKPYEWMLLENAEHSPNPEQLVRLMHRVLEFLSHHLSR